MGFVKLKDFELFSTIFTIINTFLTSKQFWDKCFKPCKLKSLLKYLSQRLKSLLEIGFILLKISLILKCIKSNGNVTFNLMLIKRLDNCINSVYFGGGGTEFNETYIIQQYHRCRMEQWSYINLRKITF